MIPTPIGLIVILAGLWLLFRPAVEMLVFVLVCTLFAGASALDMPILGHSSMPPATLALIFLGLRCFKQDVRESPGVLLGLRLNAWLIVFCVYGAMTAFVLPKIFAGRLYVIPMQKSSGYVPLGPSSQNITQAVYLMGTAFAAVAAATVMQRQRSEDVIAKALLVITGIQVATGLLDLVASSLHLSGLFDLVRNGAYAQVDQEAGDFHRLSGLAPEASTYASLGTVLMVFCVELWLRGYARRKAAAAGAAMLILLLACTSSTAYIAVAVYALILVVRGIFFPGAISLRQGLQLSVATGLLLVSALSVAVLIPHVGASILSLLADMTVNKGQSSSGVERSMWARQGWNAFIQTKGLGIGLGSFRSSSIFTAILGSAGPACLLVFIGYCLLVFKPLRGASYGRTATISEAVGVAAGWAALMQLVPAAVSSAGADPGLLFGLLCGVSLSLRSKGRPRQPRAGVEPFIARVGLPQAPSILS